MTKQGLTMSHSVRHSARRAVGAANKLSQELNEEEERHVRENLSEEELAGILLDVAALAMRLDKPLTARLMPIPGARAGDLTEFDFAYFANGRVLDVKGLGSRELFARGGWSTVLA